MAKPLYVDPHPLDRVRHAKLAIGARATPFDFARDVHVVPLAATEFVACVHDLPVLFAQDGTTIAPVALMGPKVAANVFVDNGLWTGRYIPAFLRRYPFLSATTPDGQEIVCVDQAWGGFVAEGGTPLFDAEGAPTETLQRALQLVESFSNDLKLTQAFTAELKRLDLLNTISIDLDDGQGKTASLGGFMVIDERRLDALPDAEHLFLRKQGYLVPISAHLMSLGNLKLLSKGL